MTKNLKFEDLMKDYVNKKKEKNSSIFYCGKKTINFIIIYDLVKKKSFFTFRVL